MPLPKRNQKAISNLVEFSRATMDLLKSTQSSIESFAMDVPYEGVRTELQAEIAKFLTAVTGLYATGLVSNLEIFNIAEAMKAVIEESKARAPKSAQDQQNTAAFGNIPVFGFEQGAHPTMQQAGFRTVLQQAAIQQHGMGGARSLHFPYRHVFAPKLDQLQGRQSMHRPPPFVPTMPGGILFSYLEPDFVKKLKVGKSVAFARVLYMEKENLFFAGLVWLRNFSSALDKLPEVDMKPIQELELAVLNDLQALIEIPNARGGLSAGVTRQQVIHTEQLLRKAIQNELAHRNSSERKVMMLYYAMAVEDEQRFINNALVTWSSQGDGFSVSLLTTAGIMNYLQVDLDKVPSREISDLGIDELILLRNLVNGPGNVIDLKNMPDPSMYSSVEKKLKQVVENELHRKITGNATSDSKETK